MCDKRCLLEIVQLFVVQLKVARMSLGNNTHSKINIINIINLITKNKINLIGLTAQLILLFL